MKNPKPVLKIDPTIKKPIAVSDQQQQQTMAKAVEAEVITWPMYKAEVAFKANEKFWEKKNVKTVQLDPITKFKGTLLRLGKKKKTPKGYYYKLSSDGVLSYYKKENDKMPKGYMQVTGSMVHLCDQKTKNDHLLVVQIEKFDGLVVTFFDPKSQITLEFFSSLKDFCTVSGFDHLYTQLEILGKGSFASVYKVKSIHSDRLFAAKTYFRETFENSQHKDKFVLMIKNEIMALRKVIHPGIIRLFEIVQEKDRLLLVMELVNGGDLYALIKEQKKIPEKFAALMLRGVAESLNEMHMNGFVHRDLKLENIMLKAKDQWDIKLVDFGFAEPINNEELVSKAGTPGYIPPEIFKLHPYTSKGDVFSIGVIFYSLVSGLSAFKGRNYQAVLEENRKCDISFDRSVWLGISAEFKSLIKKMLAPKPQQRISCADILEHDWILTHTCPERKISLKLMKQQSLYQQDEDSDDDEHIFDIEMSRKTNDLKSFYVRMNSQKTCKTQKSMISVHSPSRMKQSMKQVGQRSQSAQQKQQQFGQMKSQTMKASVHTKKSQIGKEKMNAYGSEGSFGEQIGKKDSVIDDNASKITMGMAEDISIPQINIAFLKLASFTFNQNKSPKMTGR